MRRLRDYQRARILNKSLPGTPSLDITGVDTEVHHNPYSLSEVSNDYVGVWYIGKWAVPNFSSDEKFLKMVGDIVHGEIENYINETEANHASIVEDVLSCVPGVSEVVYCEPLELVAPIHSIIIKMNDDLQLTREEIADWLDTLPVNLKLREDLHDNPNSRLICAG